MFIDRSVCEREIMKILNSTNDITELRPKIEQFWEKQIRSGYHDSLHTFDWFRDRVASNSKRAKSGGTEWENPADCICQKPSDISNLLTQVERGAVFSFGVNDNREVFLNQIMKSGDVVAVSLVLAISGGDIVSTDVRQSQYLLENSMQAAFQSRPEMLKMLLGFYPNTFVNPELLNLYITQAPKVVKKDYLSQNISTYNNFLKARGLKPVFSKEDAFVGTMNERVADAQILKTVKSRNSESSKRQLLGPTQ